MPIKPDRSLSAHPSEEEVEAFGKAARTGNDAGIADYLDKYGSAFVDATEHKDGWTALMWAALYGNISTVALLLQRGADIHRADSHRGRTAQMWAHESGNVAAEVLLSQWEEAFKQKEQRERQEQMERDIAAKRAAAAEVELRRQKLKHLRPVKPTLKKKT